MEAALLQPGVPLADRSGFGRGWLADWNGWARLPAMMRRVEVLDRLLADYLAMTPQARAIWDELAQGGGPVTLDHVAVRTFSHPLVDIEALDRGFVAAGYEPADSYELPGRKLYACHYEHPQPGMPKVFISSLLLDECSPELRRLVGELIAEVEPGASSHVAFASSGRCWQLSRSTYEALREESEYAAWLAAFGFRADHFAVDIGTLAGFDGLAQVNDLVTGLGYRINGDGGEIKGSPEQLLEQSATLADPTEVELSDGAVTLPGCYCEFTRRYRQPDGRRFGGFLASSAERLLSSTDKGAIAR